MTESGLPACYGRPPHRGGLLRSWAREPRGSLPARPPARPAPRARRASESGTHRTAPRRSSVSGYRSANARANSCHNCSPGCAESHGASRAQASYGARDRPRGEGDRAVRQMPGVRPGHLQRRGSQHDRRVPALRRGTGRRSALGAGGRRHGPPAGAVRGRARGGRRAGSGARRSRAPARELIRSGGRRRPSTAADAPSPRRPAPHPPPGEGWRPRTRRLPGSDRVRGARNASRARPAGLGAATGGPAAARAKGLRPGSGCLASKPCRRMATGARGASRRAVGCAGWIAAPRTRGAVPLRGPPARVR